MRKEEIKRVLDELSKCVELTFGLNVFYEQTGGLFPDFKLNIWPPDIWDKFPCIERKLSEMDLSYRYAERGFFTYFQVYSP